MSHPLPAPELTRRLRLHQSRYGGLSGIAALADTDLKYLKRMAREGKYSMRMAETLTRALDIVEKNEVRWHKNTPAIANRDGLTDRTLVNKMVFETRPPGAPVVQRRIVKSCDYSQWARCNACGGTRFSAIKTKNWWHPVRYYACDGCVDTPERVMMGEWRA